MLRVPLSFFKKVCARTCFHIFHVMSLFTSRFSSLAANFTCLAIIAQRARRQGCWRGSVGSHLREAGARVASNVFVRDSMAAGDRGRRSCTVARLHAYGWPQTTGMVGVQGHGGDPAPCLAADLSSSPLKWEPTLPQHPSHSTRCTMMAKHVKLATSAGAQGEEKGQVQEALAQEKTERLSDHLGCFRGREGSEWS